MWGYHLSVDCAGCNLQITDAGAIANFAAAMVAALQMTAYGTPTIVRFGKDPKVTGYTLVQLIETSNITAHFCDHSGEAYIDIFSCRKFEIGAALDVIARHFEPQAYQQNYLERLAPQLDLRAQIAAE
jgi:S-adenosylmethionine/arginine decarboxylase-like enzyme